ncbi:hypothetical protein H9636_07145 [Ureibacillus sp. Re31]|uniref:Phage protein n=1 Tax=Ureibacillus galli TaxID=2762222 RepID=A0ABR8XAT0_9BACL|nr:hypothetical protein [Ureibacillus galli]MBD8026433.1 hypothetical protein [Ureibacillus galli]
MSKEYEPYKHPRWSEVPSFKVVGKVPLTEEQKKQQKIFNKDFEEYMKQRQQNKMK